MTRRSFILKLDVRSPFLFAALEPSAHGVDSSALRDPEQRPRIPGDHLRGHLRHAMIALFGESSDEVRALFGAASPDRGRSSSGAQDEPQRGAIIVGDLVATSYRTSSGRTVPFSQRRMTLAHRVQIDEETGAADEGMLQVVELAAPYDSVVSFEGLITVRPTGPGGLRVPPSIDATLKQLLELISHVGAMKSAGFGEVESFALVLVEKPHAVTTGATPGDRIALDLVFDRPLLVDVYKQAFNVSVGGSIIPGGALKGALAAALEDAGVIKQPVGPLAEALSRICFSHAFPLSGDCLADRAIPAALACVGEEYRLCLSDHDADDILANGPPIYSGDWKDEDWGGARTTLQRPAADLLRQARGRVAINKSGVAATGRLFITDLVETTDQRWRVFLDRNGADQALFEQVIATFRNGFAGLGRTGAVVCAESEAADARPTLDAGAGKVVILLETPTIMTSLADRTSASDQYLAYFKDLLGVGVSAVRSVATRRLAGDFYAYRYRANPTALYAPFELTDAGAIFELTVDETAAKCLTSYLLLRYLPPRVNGNMLRDAEEWRRCPFMPQNGYGEISIWTTTSFRRPNKRETQIA